MTAAIATQAKLRPEAIALATSSESITYASLESRANQFAHYLKSLGAGPEAPVALCLQRSPEFVISALAVLKCGSPYLPLDPVHPMERLQFMVNDSGVSIVVTEPSLAGHFAKLSVRVVDATAQASVAGQPASPPAVDVEADRSAYIIYTSGSSGEPKGVEVTRANLANLISWHVSAFRLRAADRTSFVAGVAFDAAVWEIWPALSIGAALHIPEELTRTSPEAFQDWLVRHQITISFAPTVLAEQLIAEPWPPETALRFLLTGGDALHRFPRPGLPFQLVNNYGPTECTVVATSGVVPAAQGAAGLPNIGRPISNVEIHIVDENLREVAPGMSGEIYIGGAGVARGYRNRPELTAERFIDSPACSTAGRWYRTGDLGRYLPTGEIEFLGRADDQVKIRGYRIELNEINAVLNAHPSVKASAVAVREDAPGDKRLTAFLVPATATTRDEDGLREFLHRRLPDYMVPANLVWVDALPLTANGKVDRAALPVSAALHGAPPERYIAPRNSVENSVAEIIAEVLRLPRVSADADFFALGGHSLLGAQVIARLRSALGIELKLLDVFEAPTVAELAVKVEEALASQLNAMTEEEVDAALAALHGAGGRESQAR